jgi:hypothetical protein
MAWSPPMTAVANSTFSDVEYNRYIRDNLLETAPGRVVAAGQYFTTYKTNGIAYRQIASDTLSGSVNTTSSTYVNLGTGPSVTTSVGGSGMAMVWYSAEMNNTLANNQVMFSVAITGATFVPATGTPVEPGDRYRVVIDGRSSSAGEREYGFHLFKNLKSGTHTFRMQYAIGGGGTGTYTNRHLVVMPL